MGRPEVCGCGVGPGSEFPASSDCSPLMFGGSASLSDAVLCPLPEPTPLPAALDKESPVCVSSGTLEKPRQLCVDVAIVSPSQGSVSGEPLVSSVSVCLDGGGPQPPSFCCSWFLPQRDSSLRASSCLSLCSIKRFHVSLHGPRNFFISLRYSSLSWSLFHSSFEK